MRKRQYCEKLSRKALGHKCQVLNDDGNLCGRPSAREVDVHADNEIYTGDAPQWFAVFVCQKHYDAYPWKAREED